MDPITMFLVVLSAVLFLLATIGVPSHPRFSYVPAGLFLLVVAFLINRVPLH